MARAKQSHRALFLALALISGSGVGLTVKTMAQPPSQPSNPSAAGVSVNDSRAYQGYSLVAPMNSTSTFLIDMEGRIINSWTSDYTPALSAYLLPNGHLLRTGNDHAGSFPGGGAGRGGRVQEFSWDGDLIWDYSLSTDQYHPHHDICPMPNGNVLVICWDKKTPEEAIAAGRLPGTVQGQFLPDCILEVKPTGRSTGEIVWRWHAWDHLIQDVHQSKPNFGEVSEHPELIDINYGTHVMAEMLNDPKQLAKLRSLGYVGGPAPDPNQNAAQRRGPGRPSGPHPGADWMHTNSVAYHEELDQIMLSIHEFSEVWVIDHSTTIEEAASHQGGRYGKGGDLLYRWGNPKAYRNGSNVDQRLFAQHNAHWIEPGLPGENHMLVFNNGNHRPDGMYSSVDEVVIPLKSDGSYEREEFLAFGPDRATWRYTAPEEGGLFSMTISGAQRLPNGNTFICSGNQGILFEVTPEKEIVWKFTMPSLGPGGPGGPPGMFPGRPGGMADQRPGVILPRFLQDALQMTDQQKQDVAALQKDVDQQLDSILTKDQLAQLDQMSPRAAGGPGGFGPPNFGPPGFAGPGFGGPGFGGPGFGGPGFGGPPFRPPGFARNGLNGDAQQRGRPDQRQDTRRPARNQPSVIERTDSRNDHWTQGPDGQGEPPADHPMAGHPGRRRGPDGPGGPGGVFTSHRYGPDYPGLKGKALTAGDKLVDVLGKRNANGPRPRRPQ
jgi:hypothetical protein